MDWLAWEKWLVKQTERFLSWRKRRRLLKKEKQRRKNQLLDWIQALLWSLMVVLIINQYLIQGYAVPTGSMEDTILGEDRLFVNKLVYGPELLPGFGKFKGADPKRGEIVVFVNPKYQEEMGREVSGLEQLFHRLVYMITFSLVNLDVAKNGKPAHHFLVKRLIGLPGEELRLREGRVEIKRSAESEWIREEDFGKEYQALDYKVFKKFFPYEDYAAIKDNIVQQTLMQSRIKPQIIKPGLDRRYVRILLKPYLEMSTGTKVDVSAISDSKLDLFYKQIILNAFRIDTKSLTELQITQEYIKLMLRLLRPEYKLTARTEQELKREYQKLLCWYNFEDQNLVDQLQAIELEKKLAELPVLYFYLGSFNSDLKTDSQFEDYIRDSLRFEIQPQDAILLGRQARKDCGWYIPQSNFFPMGDNRDNSKDARYFDSVELDSLLGRPLFRFWPLNRFGAVRALP